MASSAVSNSPKIAPVDSKAPRKKKGKTHAPQELPILPKAQNEQEVSAMTPELKSNGGETGSESTYFRELQKNIRNVSKKLNLMHKVDAIVAENPGKSLDELVALKKINNDQKAQAMKKPGLLAQLAQLEDQLSQYKKIEQEYQEKLSAEKELLLASHREELEKLRETVKTEAISELQKTFRGRLLTLSRFLRAAAARRQQEASELSDETQAFEGALLLVYGGDISAVTCIEKIMDGSEDTVPNTEGASLSVTFSQIQKAALDEAPYSVEEAWVDEVEKARADSSEAEKPDGIATDPTVAHAGLTELDSAVPVNDADEATSASAGPPTGAIGMEAANAAAGEQWDNKGSDPDPLSESFEMVPKDPTETENTPIPTQPTSTQSWADETEAAAPKEALPAASRNDGFSEVRHGRGGRGRGGFQGDQRGGGRGRGPRGEGRGRGGFRGDGYRGRGRGGGGYRGRGRGENSNPNNTQ